MTLERIPLIITDAFKFYERVIGRVLGAVCVYGQMIKRRRHDHLVKVERRAVIGAGRLKQALRDSEDSVKLNMCMANSNITRPPASDTTHDNAAARHNN